MRAALIPNSVQTATATRTRISVIAENRYLAQAQPMGLANALRDGGSDVELIDTCSVALCAHNSPFSSEHVVIARGRDWPTFSLLRSAELAGAIVINSASAVASVFDKARMSVELAAADIPTPPTWIGSPSVLGAQLSAIDFPVVVKPVNGDNGTGIRIVRTKHELAQIGDAPVLVQQYVANDGFDLKVYCIGHESWLVRKPTSFAALGTIRNADPELLPIGCEFRALADQCRLCFGLELFGIDCIQTPSGPTVIEVNEFPNYTAVPHASEILAEYVRARIVESGH